MLAPAPPIPACRHVPARLVLSLSQAGTWPPLSALGAMPTMESAAVQCKPAALQEGLIAASTDNGTSQTTCILPLDLSPKENAPPRSMPSCCPVLCMKTDQMCYAVPHQGCRSSLLSRSCYFHCMMVAIVFSQTAAHMGIWILALTGSFCQTRLGACGRPRSGSLERIAGPK